MAESPAPKLAHEVLVSHKVTSAGIGQLANARITHAPFGQGRRLATYDLAVFDYTEFDGKSAPEVIDHFSKQLLEALDKGTTFCFVHYADATPGQFATGANHGYLNDNEAKRCFQSQAGFRWLWGEKIRVGSSSVPSLQGKIHRAEFAEFFKKWGASHNFFELFGGRTSFDDMLYSRDGAVLAFTMYRSRGMIIYLPFQRNGLNQLDQKVATETLVDALLTYKSKRHRDFPNWAQAPFFEDEVQLQRTKADLEAALRANEEELAAFIAAKALLFANEGDLEVGVPKFVREKLAIPTLRDETYNEDFWLLDDAGTKTAICEVKSVTKGFKKGAIYEVYNHREARSQEENFPAILFVNANLQAASWEKKEVSIPVPEQRIAVDNNVLIVRIEDLVRLWDGVRKGVLEAAEARRVLHESKGWCEVTRDLKIHLRMGT